MPHLSDLPVFDLILTTLYSPHDFATVTGFYYGTSPRCLKI